MSKVYTIYVETTHGTYYCGAYLEHEQACLQLIDARKALDNGEAYQFCNGLIIAKSNLRGMVVLQGMTLVNLRNAA